MYLQAAFAIAAEELPETPAAHGANAGCQIEGLSPQAPASADPGHSIFSSQSLDVRLAGKVVSFQRLVNFDIWLYTVQ